MTKAKTKRTTSRKTTAKKLPTMSRQLKIVVLAAALFLGGVTSAALINRVYADSPKNDVPLAETAQARIWNVSLELEPGTIRVQFDYDLANGATTAVVDAALVGAMSFNQNTVTGPGHYDEKVTGLPDGTYYVALIISGSPDYILGDSGPSNQPFAVTFPDGTLKPNNPSVKQIRKFYHSQQQLFR